MFLHEIVRSASIQVISRALPRRPEPQPEGIWKVMGKRPLKRISPAAQSDCSKRRPAAVLKLQILSGRHRPQHKSDQEQAEPMAV